MQFWNEIYQTEINIQQPTPQEKTIPIAYKIFKALTLLYGIWHGICPIPITKPPPMKKFLLILPLSIMLLGCSGVKRTQEALNTGNYLSAMNRALDNLRNNKTKKGNQAYVLLLEEAFAKHTQKEVERASFLEKEGNPANFEAIYNTYAGLKQLQEQIKPLLPLPIYDENRNAKFSFANYDSKILNAKTHFSEYLYASASDLLEHPNSKMDYRVAYDKLAQLESLSPNYSDTRDKMAEAHAKGVDYVEVVLENDTEQVLPQRLEGELLDFNTFGLNDLWTEYHTNTMPQTRYDYQMLLALTNIDISPEQVKEKVIVKEKQIKDGYTYAKDSRGNIQKDSLGNKIKIDKFKTVTCTFNQFTQFKSARVTGQVRFLDLNTQQQVNTYPLSSEFVFENNYANYNGDKRALENALIDMLSVKAVPFPTNEQMVYDAGEDLKAHLKDILVRQKFNQ